MATVYDKSSLFLAPSGVSNGTVFVQKPVPIYGSEQVTNGDFSQEGAELITNGDFATDTDWTADYGASQSDITISNGELSFISSATYGFAKQQINVTSGKIYKITADIKSFSGSMRLFSSSGNAAKTINSTGIITSYFTPIDATTLIGFSANNDIGASVVCNSISCVEVGQDWTLGTGWSIGEDKAICDGSGGGIFPTPNSLTSGAIVKFQVTISDRTNGYIRIQNPSSTIYYVNNINTNGTFEYSFTTIDANGWRIEAIGGFNGSITNISVQEVLSPDGDFTFTRGSNLSATRVNEAQLIEKGRENLLSYSNNFSQWTKSGTTVTGSQIGYDGSSDAWLITKSGGAFDQILRNVSASGVNTISFYAKAGTLTSVYFRGQASSSLPDAKFNLLDGSLTSSNNIISATSKDIGSGWYRLEMAFTNTITNVTIYPDFGQATAGNILIQDAQLEQGLAATSVITTGAGTVQAGLLENTPRLDYSGGATCPSLLLEPSRSNLVPSEYFQEFWSIASGGTRVYNQITSPEGLQNGTKMYPTSTGSFKGLSKAFGSSLSSTPYALSIFAKAGEFEHLYFFNVGSPDGNNGVWFNLTTGSVGTNQSAWTSAKMEDFGNGWYRCSAVITPSGSSDNIYILLADSNGSVTSTTNGTDGLYIYGAQLEQSSYATSYIPNYGTPQTRAQDVCGEAGDVNTFNSTEGVLYAEIAALDPSGTYRLISLSSGSDLNRVFIGLDTTTGYLYYYVIVGGNVQANGGSLIYPSEFTKVAVKYKENDFAFWINGVKVSSDSSGTTFPANTLNVLKFNSGSPTVPFYGKTKELIVFPTALSDLQLAILTGATTYETFDEMALALNYTVYE